MSHNFYCVRSPPAPTWFICLIPPLTTPTLQSASGPNLFNCFYLNWSECMLNYTPVFDGTNIYKKYDLPVLTVVSESVSQSPNVSAP